jgi:hypothetical protein
MVDGISESTGSMWNADVKRESDDEEDEIVTWDDVAELVKTRIKEMEFSGIVDGSSLPLPPSLQNQVPNRMAIQNLI